MNKVELAAKSLQFVENILESADRGEVELPTPEELDAALVELAEQGSVEVLAIENGDGTLDFAYRLTDQGMREVELLIEQLEADHE